MIGAGGVGIGTIWHLDDGRDIGRDESRPARLGDERDRCKLHIVLHYVSVLARGLGWQGRVAPVALVGDDVAGRALRGELRGAGMDLRWLRVAPRLRTMTSVCWQFRDGGGGNFTESASACAALTPAAARRAVTEAWPARGGAIAVALPEAPLAARAALVAAARARGGRVVGSFASTEIASALRDGLLRAFDVVALNRDEAAALAGAPIATPAATLASRCAARLARENPSATVVVTDGARGAYGCAGDVVSFAPPLRIAAANTAGAGDAFLAGLIVAILRGLPLVGDDEATGLRLAGALAAMSTLSRDTINDVIDARALRAFLRARRACALVEALDG